MLLADNQTENDMVNHPAHYCSGGIECLDAIKAAIYKYDNPYEAFLAGQIIKYIWRAPLKNAYDQDIHKAQFYMNRLIENIQERKGP